MRCLLLSCVLFGVLGSSATCGADDAKLYVFADIGDGQLGLINTETDQLVQVDVASMPDWPGNGVVHKQHAWVTPDGKTIYMSIDAMDPSPAGIVVFDVNGIDWDEGTADLTINKTLEISPPGETSRFPELEQVNPEQPIAHWTQPAITQIHGPSFRPRSPYSYATVWTDDRIVAFNYKTNQFTWPGPTFSYGEFSRHTHGIVFNSRGNLALGTGYYYDQTSIDVYFFIRGLSIPIPVYSFDLRQGRERGAFTHYTVWLNNRYAYTASMQFAKTSLSGRRQRIGTPAVWLLDLWTGRATRVIDTAVTADDPGIFRSPSDQVIANGKLYVAEEDTLDGSYADDGYVSVFDLRNPRKPRFVKRLKPGEDLPDDFAVAHGLTVTPDQKSVYVASYISSYVAKIDTATDTVTKVWGPDDGLSAPHGGFVAGSNR